ncbi:hypothetical protein SUGI_0605100 [Cryptomeria japonica]|nr:hypothetical protein SUGI_0605100 [Cryptomeria japonica]
MYSVEEASALSWLIPEANKNNLRAVSESGGDDEKTVKGNLKFKAYLQNAVPTIHMGPDSKVPVHSPKVFEHSSQ